MTPPASVWLYREPTARLSAGYIPESEMFRMWAPAVLVALSMASLSAAADVPSKEANTASNPNVVPSAHVATSPPTPLAADVDWSAAPLRVRPSRGALLPSLYSSLAGLNAFDAYSTLTGIQRGASESNPLMSGVAGNAAALWAVKSGVTAGSIVVADRLWRQKRKAAAIAVMALSNGVMAAVAARNASVLRQQR